MYRGLTPHKITPMSGVLHAKSGLRVFFEVDDRSFRLGDHGRYPTQIELAIENMGWDGVCIFEERIDGHWSKVSEVNIQDLIYRVAGSLHASFVTNDPQERDDMNNGQFLWSDLSTASIEELEDGHFRTTAEILERLARIGEDALVSALTDSGRHFRATCLISC